MFKLNKIKMIGKTKNYTVKSITGSLSFNGSNTQLTVPAGPSWAPGTNDFTIEWFMNMNNDADFPRIFSINAYPTASIACSIEGGSAIFWIDGNFVAGGSLTNYIGAWNHIALVRQGTTATIYQNGISIGSGTNLSNISNTSDILSIGCEDNGGGVSQTFFDGYLTNFRFVNGTAVYTSNFASNISALTPITNTELLLLASTSGTYLNDSSINNYMVTNVGGNVTWSSNVP